MLDEGAPRDPQEIEEELWSGMTGALAFDIGANMGQSVTQMLKRGFEQVYAAEPAEESYRRLAESFAVDSHVKPLPYAISNHDGMLTLAVREAPIMTGQLVAEGMPYENELPHERAMARWGRQLDVRKLPCRTVDTLVRNFGPPDFVKVDTEGHELQVLTGALQLIASRHAKWLIEFHREDLYHGCVNLLRFFGYRVDTMRHPHYPPRSHMWFNHGWIRAFPTPRIEEEIDWSGS